MYALTVLRRISMKRTFVLGAIIAIGALSMATSAFQGAPAGRQGGPNVAQIQKVTDNLYMIIGGGGKPLPLFTFGGVIFIQTKLRSLVQTSLAKRGAQNLRLLHH